MTRTDPLTKLLPTWLPKQRWFAGKGRPIEAVTPAASATLRRGDPSCELTLYDVRYGDGGPGERYHVLLGRRSDLPVELEHVLIGVVDGWAVYDGIWDPVLSMALLSDLAEGARRGFVEFVPEPGAEVPTGLSGRVLTIEQSNTSVAYGEECILKQFRRVASGPNPDLELHRALRVVGSEHVADLRAAIEIVVAGERATLAMLQDFAANSASGWPMALISVRDLFGEADLHADEVGGDFAGEAWRLGEAVASVHLDLARALGTSELDAGEVAVVMSEQLQAAVRAVPALAEFAPAIGAVYAELAKVPDPISAQRIHGDLHLGQTLRTPIRWLLIDFEGEPARPLAERIKPDSALRDVAGMLRSFDYAAHHQLDRWDDSGTVEAGQLAWRANEWSDRNREAFCAGYASLAEADPRDQRLLLRVFELDKAVYETIYETRNRPDWLAIPLDAVRRLSAADSP